MRVLITGGAGFIGSHLVQHFVDLGHEVIVADRFTYAGKGRNLAAVLDKVQLLIGDLSSGDLPARCATTRPDWVVHVAAETHVDHAISDPERFMVSNVLGTTRLLQGLWTAGRRLHSPHGATERWPQKVIVYSTDEVFGPTPAGVAFDEQTPFKPSNAYSASKVGVEGVATAFHVTHGAPVVIVRPCNTYGPRQHPEKVIPRFVEQMLAEEPVTIYNDGRGSRDWLHVHDHARAIATLCEHGVPGQAYNLAAGEEHTDFAIYTLIRDTLLEYGLIANVPQHTFVPGRPGHDRRYAMTGAPLRALGWAPQVPFVEGFRSTVLWNAAHEDWFDHDLVQLPRLELVGGDRDGDAPLHLCAHGKHPAKNGQVFPITPGGRP